MSASPLWQRYRDGLLTDDDLHQLIRDSVKLVELLEARGEYFAMARDVARRDLESLVGFWRARGLGEMPSPSDH